MRFCVSCPFNQGPTKIAAPRNGMGCGNAAVAKLTRAQWTFKSKQKRERDNIISCWHRFTNCFSMFWSIDHWKQKWTWGELGPGFTVFVARAILTYYYSLKLQKTVEKLKMWGMLRRTRSSLPWVSSCHFLPASVSARTIVPTIVFHLLQSYIFVFHLLQSYT